MPGSPEKKERQEEKSAALMLRAFFCSPLAAKPGEREGRPPRLFKVIYHFDLKELHPAGWPSTPP